jgi:hypothetical protein
VTDDKSGRAQSIVEPSPLIYLRTLVLGLLLGRRWPCCPSCHVDLALHTLVYTSR